MYFSDKKSLKQYLWKINQYNEQKVLSIVQKFGFSEILSRLLTIRGIEIDEIEDFLNPTIKHTLQDPYLLLDMENGVNIVYEAIVNKKNICIFGDYDVDGVSSCALMKNYFNLIGIDVVIYIPDRLSEGYGPNANAFTKLKKENNIDLILTVDCGISGFDSCKVAKELGVQVVITDHHLGNITMPEADAIIDPNRFDEANYYSNLAGVGVGFLFLIALNRKLRNNNFFKDNNIKEPNLLEFLDLVALGTICDVVPLVGLNRAFVRQGLKVIKQRTNVGIKSLIDVSEIDEEVNTYHVGFILGPRINATGRVGEANMSSKLLYLKDSFETMQLAKKLDYCNKERQNIEKNVLDEALEQITKKELYNDNIIFVEGENWHEGVIGIIASKIKDKFERPTIVLSKINDYYRASCRSVNGVDIGNVIIEAKIKNLIKDGGGHAMAGGFTVEEDKLDELKDFFNNKLNKSVENFLNNREKNVDLVLECKSLSIKLANEIEKLGPFGAGNHKPKVVLKDVVIVKYDVIGKNQNNLRLIVCDNDLIRLSKGITAICFRINQDEKIFSVLKTTGKRVSLLGEININKWQGQESVQFIIEDVIE